MLFIHIYNSFSSSFTNFSVLFCTELEFLEVIYFNPWAYTSVLEIPISLSSGISKRETIWPNVAGSFVQIARSANVPVVLDAGGADTPISQELLKCVTVLRVNEAELARLTGMETNNLDQITVAAMSIHQLVCSSLIVEAKTCLQFGVVFKSYFSQTKEKNMLDDLSLHGL